MFRIACSMQAEAVQMYQMPIQISLLQKRYSFLCFRNSLFDIMSYLRFQVYNIASISWPFAPRTVKLIRKKFKLAELE